MTARRARASRPWDTRAEELHEAVPQLSRAWTKWFAKREYLAENHDNPLPRWGLAAARYVIAYGVQGQFKDDYAKTVERIITKVPSRHAQDVNAVLSTLEAVLISDGIYEGFKYAGHQDAADASLWVTATFTAVNVGWNVYRVAKRDGKCRPAIGYGSAVAHTVGYALESAKAAPTILEQCQQRARREGVDTFYAGLETLVDNVAASAKATGQAIKRIF